MALLCNTPVQGACVYRLYNKNESESSSEHYKMRSARKWDNGVMIKPEKPWNLLECEEHGGRCSTMGIQYSGGVCKTWPTPFGLPFGLPLAHCWLTFGLLLAYFWLTTGPLVAHCWPTRLVSATLMTYGPATIRLS